ncbi:MAG: class I SAM-dependent methyltransferase [Planctomycetes bacterium]|nr:class I SAM-dependent methyltransferase [Planctomycetota bacterium]
MEEHVLYRSESIISLFDEMARTYGKTNTLSSFGFSQRWRKQCVDAIEIPDEGRVLDLMTGAGELLHVLHRRGRRELEVSAVDFSPEMVRRANENAKRWRGFEAQVIEADVLKHDFLPNHFDAVISSFGLKTLSVRQLAQLAQVIAATLKPGGCFSLLEISVPKGFLWRIPFMFYVKRVIPLIGRLCLGNPDNYRFLGVYTEAFGSCESTLLAFQQAGLEVEVKRFFFGCATALVGSKPE